MTKLKIMQSHAWRPDPEVEKRPVNGEVITRQMTPEERERYKNFKQTTDSNGKPIKRPNVGWRTNEKEYREMRAEMAKRKGKWDHVTKEYLEKEFAKGRTASEIEKQLGMPKSGIYGLMKRYGIVSPHGLKSKVRQEVVPGESAVGVIGKLQAELEDVTRLNDSLIAKLKEVEEERDQLAKMLDSAKGYADTAQICKVDQVQEGNHIVIKIPILKEVSGG